MMVITQDNMTRKITYSRIGDCKSTKIIGTSEN